MCRQGKFSSPCLGILFLQIRIYWERGTFHVFVPMFGDSFFTQHRKGNSTGKACFRPHVWGFFFYLFSSRVDQRNSAVVFVPMFGDSFFTRKIWIHGKYREGFSSPCLGILFLLPPSYSPASTDSPAFSSPCLGILFLLVKEEGGVSFFKVEVFVPMFGDSFFTRKYMAFMLADKHSFRPHVWGFFFHFMHQVQDYLKFSCFRPHVWGFFFHRGQKIQYCKLPQTFSSPCLGILFSQGCFRRRNH